MYIPVMNACNSVDNIPYVCCLELTPSAGALAFGPNLQFNLSEILKVLWTFYMLHLVDEPILNTLSLTPFERSYSVSVTSQ